MPIDPNPTSPPPDSDSETDTVCPACPHPVAAHDAIAQRFCTAMAAGGQSRRCLCSGKSAGMTYGNSTRAPISGDVDHER